MINISIYNNGFLIEGHANSARYGNDLVCASISSISQGIINCFPNKNIKTLDIRNGYINFNLYKVSKKDKIILETFYILIDSIYKDHQKYINLELGKENK